MKASSIAFGAALVLFVAGLLAAIQLRFDTGDVYPPLSTFRSDPLGAKVLYESLAALPGVTVQRTLDAELTPTGGTFVLLGLSLWTVERRVETLRPLLDSGGRVVLVLLPESSAPHTGAMDIGRELGAKFRFGPKLTSRRGGVPKETVVWLADLDPAWKVLKTGPHGPVAAERNLRKGSLLLSTEAYPFSNEALAANRDAALLAAAMGSLPNITFDEAHHGIRETPGVALLIRKYRLHAIFASFAATALLFIWSVAIPFGAPPAGHSVAVVASDASRSFARLLERHLASRDLLGVCIDEWRKTAGASPARIAEVEAIAKSNRDPVASYQAIKAMLDSQSRSHSNSHAK